MTEREERGTSPAACEGSLAAMNSQLDQVLTWAERSPFYHGRVPADFEECPLTTKADLRAAYPQVTSSRPWIDGKRVYVLDGVRLGVSPTIDETPDHPDQADQRSGVGPANDGPDFA